MGITGKMEDYLEAIYLLRTEKQLPVRVKELSSQLDLSKSTIVIGIKKLKELKLVEHEHYGYITLTHSGEKIAKKIYSRHLTLKDFLINVLKVKEDVAENEACEIEHALSDNTIEKIIQFTNEYKETNN